jgi:bla regulator protein blaR1
MNSPILVAVANHLWQSTLFAVLVGLLTLSFRKNSANVRYALWLVASLKFLVPFSLLTALGAQLPWFPGAAYGSAAPSALFALAGNVAARVALPVAQNRPDLPVPADSTAIDVLTIVAIVWALGAVGVAMRWLVRWRQLRRTLRESSAVRIDFPVPVKSSATQIEPGVVGVVSPVLLIPEGMEDRLTPEQMRAVLAHERCHVQRRDNLAASLHMLVEALFWFHPLVWWLGARLVDERERACDEQVLREGHAPESYAEGILKICQHYLESKLPCVAGVGGANLKQRIEDIMKNSLIVQLSGARRLALIVAGGAAVIGPVLLGMVTSPAARAQAESAGQPSDAGYTDFAIHLTAPDEKTAQFGVDPRTNALRARNRSMRALISFAYQINEPQILGPDWLVKPSFDVDAFAPQTGNQMRHDDHRELMRKLLEQHFGLVMHRERKNVPGYVMRVDSGGSKLKPEATGTQSRFGFGPNGGGVVGLPLDMLVNHLSNRLDAPVLDETRLTGTFNYSVQWGPENLPPDPAVLADPVEVGRSMKEQLGLTLEAATVNVEVLNVLSLKRPAEVVTTRVAGR